MKHSSNKIRRLFCPNLREAQKIESGFKLGRRAYIRHSFWQLSAEERTAVLDLERFVSLFTHMHKLDLYNSMLRKKGFWDTQSDVLAGEPVCLRCWPIRSRNLPERLVTSRYTFCVHFWPQT